MLLLCCPVEGGGAGSCLLGWYVMSLGCWLVTGVSGVAPASLGGQGMLLAAVWEAHVRGMPAMRTAARGSDLCTLWEQAAAPGVHPSLEVQWSVLRLALHAAGMLAGRALSARRWLLRSWQQAPSWQPTGRVQMALPEQPKHCTSAGAGWQQSPCDVATVRPLSTT